MLSKAPRYRGDISACASSRYQAHFPSGKCGLGSRLMLNRKFVRIDDVMKDFEETATAFNVSQTSHNSRKKL